MMARAQAARIEAALLASGVPMMGEQIRV